MTGSRGAGSVGALSVAPMIDWTDTHCRAFHRILAPDALLYTEMVHANAILHGPREKLLAKDATQHPVALQLGGSEPEALARATAIVAAAGFDEINLNCGCPSDRVQSGKFGACLMREPQRVADCVAAMIAATDKPVTVKCRLGVDDDDEYAKFAAFVAAIAAAGCRRVIVHARNAWLKGLSPKENRDIPPLKYDWAYRLKQDCPELHIALNGGIRTLAEVQEHLQHVDSVMLGRLAYHDPYQLHCIDAALHGKVPLERETLLRAYRPYVEAQLHSGLKLNAMSRHFLGLFLAQKGGRMFRQILSENAHRGGIGWELVEEAILATH